MPSARYADALDDGDGPPRTRGQKMADCLLDLVLRPGETELPAVQAQLTVVAPVATWIGGDQPAEVGDRSVPAEMLRALARGLGLLPTARAPAADSAPGESRSDADAEEVDEFENDELDNLALERWWVEVEARALRGEWGGEEDPPQDELERYWAREAEWMAQWPDDESVPAVVRGDEHPSDAARPTDVPSATASVHPTDAGRPEAPSAREPIPPWWGRADLAVQDAGAGLLDLQRRLARARSAVDFARLAETTEQEEWEQSPAARITWATDTVAALAHATEEQRAALARLLDTTGGGGLVDRPRIALTDALTGALLVLTDARELRAHATCGADACRRGIVVCTHDVTDLPGLAPPGPSSTYRPGAALDRFLRARDRRCRQPGCRRRVPRGGELDHNVPYPDGPTAAHSMVGFCTGHHRGKHQAPGWRYDLSPDGHAHRHHSHRDGRLHRSAALLSRACPRPRERPIACPHRRIPFRP